MRVLLSILLLLAPLDAFAAGVLCSAGGTGTTSNTCTTSGQILVSQGDGTALEKTMSGDCTIDATGAITCSGGGGSAIIFDIGDDSGNDSTDVAEIATTGDTNGIFSEPSADKILVNLSNNWPTADTADALSTNPAACSAGQYVSDLDADGTLTCSAPTDTNAGSLCAANEVLDGDGSCYDRIQKITGTPTDNQIVRWHSTDGKSIQISSCTIDDSGNLDCDGQVQGSCTPASDDCGMITDDNSGVPSNPGASKCHIYSRGENPYAICGAGGSEKDLAAGAGSGDSISIDSVGVVDPDFQDGGDINFTDTSNVVTATIKANTVQTDEIDLSISPTWTGAHDFDGAGATLEIPQNSGEPASCTVGEIVYDSAASSGQRIKACESTNTWQVQGDGSGGSTNYDTIGDPSGDGQIDHAATAQVHTWNTPATAVAHIGMDYQYTCDASSDATAQYVVRAARAAATGACTMDAILLVENLDSNDDTADGILVSDTGTQMTDGIDVSDSSITNAINIGANNILTAATTIASTELDVLDNGIEDGDVPNNITIDLATLATTATVSDAAADTTTSVVIVDGTTGSLGMETDAGLTYNASTNAVTATTFIGALTGNASTASDLSGCTDCLNATEIEDIYVLLAGDSSSGNYTWTGDHDFSGGGIEIENGTTPPACTEGQIYLDTDATAGQQFYACDAGTFVLQGDGNANTECTGTTTYLDGDGGCDDISTVYEAALTDEASLESTLSDVTTNFSNNTGAGEFDITASQTVSVFLPAGAITCHTTAGCTDPAQIDGTNFSYMAAAFATDADDSGTFVFTVPSNMAGTTATVEFWWHSDNAACNGGADDDVCWTIDSDSFADDAAFETGSLAGTEEAITDKCTADGDIMQATTAAFTHSWTADGMAVVTVKRDVDGSATDCSGGTADDDYAQDAKLIGVRINFEVDNVFSGEN